MATYTITSKFFAFICSEKKEKYIYNVLMSFSQENPLKISVDRDKKALSIYRDIINKKDGLESKDTVLTLINYIEENNYFERIDSCDISTCRNEDELFLAICSQTQVQKKIIIDSHNNWDYPSYIPERSKVFLYNGIEIDVFDKDEASVDIKKTLIQLQTSATMPTSANNSSSQSRKPWWKVPAITVAIITTLGTIAIAIINNINNSATHNAAEVCYSITVIDKKSNLPAIFNNSKVQMTVQRKGSTYPLPITRSSCKYCTTEKLEPTEKVYLTLDNSEYSVIGTDHYLKSDSDNQILVEKRK